MCHKLCQITETEATTTAIQYNNFNPVPTKNAKNAPQAALNEVELSLFAKHFSPIKAPANGPTRNPKGIGSKMPAIKPIVAPQLPAFPPPNRFVIQGVNIKSSIVTATITTPHITKAIVVKSVYPLQLNKSIATKDIGGPGNAGTIHPAKPPHSNNIPKINNTISI